MLTRSLRGERQLSWWLRMETGCRLALALINADSHAEGSSNLLLLILWKVSLEMLPAYGVGEHLSSIDNNACPAAFSSISIAMGAASNNGNAVVHSANHFDEAPLLRNKCCGIFPLSSYLRLSAVYRIIAEACINAKLSRYRDPIIAEAQHLHL